VFEVYCFTSPSGKRYVGFTSRNVDHRWTRHVQSAQSGSACPFHNAIRKYGPKSFTRSLLERMTTEAGAKRAEQLWIKELGTFGPGGYNATRGGDGVIGLVRSLEMIAKTAASNRGKVRSREARANMAEAHRGKFASSEARVNMSNAHKGKKHLPETRAKISEAARNRFRSPEARAEMAEAKRNISDETRAQMSKSAKLRWAKRKTSD
jgi:group I intron endonuclease